MRLMLVCEIARMFPANMVNAASPHNTGTRSALRDGRTVTKMRKRAANPAALAPTAMKPVTEVGAPW